jgi:hypothetical protein
MSLSASTWLVFLAVTACLNACHSQLLNWLSQLVYLAAKLVYFLSVYAGYFAVVSQIA